MLLQRKWHLALKRVHRRGLLLESASFLSIAPGMVYGGAGHAFLRLSRGQRGQAERTGCQVLIDVGRASSA
eukprot:582269-Pelagomonas_calceolata.AAC.3